MAASAPPPAAATSPIEKLPAELLERILLEAVDPVASPTIHGKGNRKAWQRKLMTRKCITVYALQVRLVCHNFRDLARRAFGKVVGETIFDLASRRSFDALQAIIKVPDLAPWISKLTLSCNVRWGNDEDEPNITKESLEELAEVRCFEASWFPGVFSRILALEVHSEPPSWTGKNPMVGAFIQYLSDTMRKLPNLNEVAYAWDVELPAQCYSRGWLLSPELDPTLDMDDWEAFGAHFGLTMVLQALDNARIQPSKLDLAVEMVDSNSFLMYAPTELFSNVCKRVTSLTVREQYCPVCIRGPTKLGTKITVTGTIFPRLQSLTIYTNNLNSDAALSIPAMVGTLKHLAVVDADLQEQNNKLLLEHYGTNLHCLDLVNIDPRGLDNVFDTIKAMNLGILNVRQSSDRYWRNEADSPDDWSEWHKGGKYMSLAKEVFLQPPSFQV